MGLGIGIGNAILFTSNTSIGTFPPFIKCYIARVEAAGGTIESPNCITSLGLNEYNWDYACRVNSAGGTIESIQCATI